MKRKKNKHNAELRRTARDMPAPPPPNMVKKIYLDTVLKIIFSQQNIPGSKCVTCSSFTDRKYPKNAKKYLKNIKWSKIFFF